MKAILFGIAIAATTFSACTENSSQSKETNATDTTTTSTPTTSEAVNPTSSNEVVTHYLHLKNALANDDAKEAASAGKAVSEALDKIGSTSLTAEQKLVYDDVKDDMKEHAQHIGDNAGKIEHQREHFEMLSNGLYDLVKVINPSQTLYQAHCPMYNDKKGANWLSEVKEIKNPYYGKEMLTCGTIKEEIK
jgi:hypothetical protein